MACQTTQIDICRTRGDTAPFTVTITTDGTVPVNITGFAFKLTVDPAPDPVDNTTKLFDVIGVITNTLGGVVQFTLTLLNSDQAPGEYYYDVQMTDGGGFITTVLKGKWIVEQDITK